MISLAQRAGWRHLWRHPWQVGLAVLGVALGVAVVVAVNIANTSASRAFQLSIQTVAGKSTDQIVGGPAGLSDRLYTRLRLHARIPASAPIVAGFGRTGDQTLQVLGIDPFAETDFRNYFGAAEVRTPVRKLLTEPGSVLLAPATAKRLGLTVGRRFKLQVAGRIRPVRLVGLLSVDPQSAPALDGLLVTDIATAQSLLDSIGRLTRIDLMLPSGAAGERARARIRRLLPPEAQLQPAGARAQDLMQMTAAFRTNLTAMSLLGLVVGMFLIYNTMTFTVLQRRTLIGTLRVLGVTRREVFTGILAEALAVGAAGSALGLVLGIMLGNGLVRLVTRTINDLYFVLTVSQLQISAGPLLLGAGLGLGATILAALGPALEAGRTAPGAALSRSLLEHRVRRLLIPLAVAGLAMAAVAGLLLLLPTRSLVAGFAVLFLLVLGLSLVTPLAVALLVRLAGAAGGPMLGIQGRLAVRGVSASLSRTGVAIAALMLAVATTVGVGVMVASFRTTVAGWLTDRLQADIYLAAAGTPGAGPPPPLAPGVLAQVRAIPGVAQVTGSREITVPTGDGPTRIMAVQLATGRAPRFALKTGDPSRVWPAFRAGRLVLVSEAYAYRHRVAAGDSVSLPTADGTGRFKVGGVYYDYQSGPGVVLMARRLFVQHWHDRRFNSLGIYVQPGTPVARVMDALRKFVHSDQHLMVRANGAIRAASLRVFDRTFAITNVLRLLAVLVAFVGILSALMALQLERARELAILRATGFTPGQLRGMVTLQTGFMGLLAGLLALPVGLALALLLIHVINRRAFGWSMQTLVPGGILAEALVLAVTAAVLAGLYPAWKMARTSPAQALRDE